MSILLPKADVVFQDRYAIDGEIWEDASLRTGLGVAKAEDPEKHTELGEQFAEMIFDLLFLPGGRTLRGVGRPMTNLLNCYALEVEDSMDSIGDTISKMWQISAEGGGVGIAWGKVRPGGEYLNRKDGYASGPVSFMRCYDVCADVICSGGFRHAALKHDLPVWHPEIKTFIEAKLDNDVLTNCNISVAITNQFIEAARKNRKWELRFGGKVYDTVRARDLWMSIMEYMVKCGEPGLVNFDNLRKNNSWYFAPIVTTNPSLRKGTRILTEDGIYPIEELEGFYFKVRGLSGELANAKCLLSGRNKQLFKVELQGGHAYYATAEHKWPTTKKDMWSYCIDDVVKKTTSELKTGDFIPRPSFKTSLDFGNSGSYEDGFCIGWNIGDGWLSNNDRPLQIGFIVSDDDKKDGIDQVISNWLRSLSWTGMFNKNEINVQNKKVRQVFKKFLVQKKRFGLPRSVWNSASEDFRRGLIDGLYSSDGYIDSGGKIVLTTSYEPLANDVADLLGFYGLQVSVRTSSQKGNFPDEKYNGHTYTRHDVVISSQSSITHFSKIFKLSVSKKQEALNDAVTKISLALPTHSARVMSVTKIDSIEDVWDLTVFDDDHCFELPHCITGNCGELPLENYGSCCLGHINLAKFVTPGGNTRWQEMKTLIHLAVRFLDNVIGINNYFIQACKDTAFRGRRIGLGIMGFADYLFAKEIRYGSEECVKAVDELGAFIRNESYAASIELAKEKGAFQAFDREHYCDSKFIRRLPRHLQRRIYENGIRNVTLNTIAPTGTVSLLAGVSSGCEPLFKKAYKRKDQVEDKAERTYIHERYKEILLQQKDKGARIVSPSWYVDSFDITPFEHLEVQRAFQDNDDGAIAKTINCPEGTTASDLSRYLLRYIGDLKGVTVYVDGSRKEQVLYPLSDDEALQHLDTAESTEIQDCATGVCEI